MRGLIQPAFGNTIHTVPVSILPDTYTVQVWRARGRGNRYHVAPPVRVAARRMPSADGASSCSASCGWRPASGPGESGGEMYEKKKKNVIYV